MIVLNILGYFCGKKQNSYAALRFVIMLQNVCFQFDIFYVFYNNSWGSLERLWMMVMLKMTKPRKVAPHYHLGIAVFVLPWKFIVFQHGGE